METVWRFLKTLKLELPYYPAIPLLGIYPKKMKTLIWKDICAPMFITALFTIAKMWKHPTCPSKNKCGLWFIYTAILFSLKKEGNPVICDNRDEPWGNRAKWNKPVKKRQILHNSTSLRYWSCPIHRNRKWNGECQGLGGGGREGFCCSVDVEFQCPKMKKFRRSAVEQCIYS